MVSRVGEAANSCVWAFKFADCCPFITKLMFLLSTFPACFCLNVFKFFGNISDSFFTLIFTRSITSHIALGKIFYTSAFLLGAEYDIL